MPISFDGQHIMLLDQRKLPARQVWFDATSLDDMVVAIRDMIVRGAPSIGAAAALSLAVELHRLASLSGATPLEVLAKLEEGKRKLESTRPTAVNLRWGCERIFHFAESLLLKTTMLSGTVLNSVSTKVLAQAIEIIKHHVTTNETLSNIGAELLPADAEIITHCNAGALAACGWGTALGVIRAAAMKGLNPHVFVDETRPRVQGAKLTIWELEQDNIPATLICDGMAAHIMATQNIDAVITGADRIATNGDTANKIGTYSLAIAAHYHHIPFYIAAPLSTFDPRIDSRKSIPIEVRGPQEVIQIDGHSICANETKVFNPSFDVTPAELITGIITEYGVLRPPYSSSIMEALESADADDAGDGAGPWRPVF